MPGTRHAACVTGSPRLSGAGSLPRIVRRFVIAARSSLESLRLRREQAKPEREAHVFRPRGHSQLFVDALLVGIHGLRTDGELTSDVRSRVSLGDESQDVALSVRKRLEKRAIVSDRVVR